MENNNSNNISKNKSYFISDVHLGVPDYDSSLLREKKMVAWLESIEHDAENLFILGDIFDMWFDYKQVAPRGYVRLLGQLATMSDNGINIHYFIGNHDMWVFDYFEQEIGLKVYREPKEFTLNGKNFLLGHGDGLGPGDGKYKFIKSIFANRINQWFFARLHPNFALGLAQYFSRKSRISNGNFEEHYEGDDKEILYQYCKSELAKKHYDYFVFGHRHIAMDKDLGNNSRYINLGEWVKNPHIGEFNGEGFKLLSI